MIGIAQVLNEIDASAYGEPFIMTFVTEDGSLREINGQKGYVSQKTSKGEGNRTFYNIKQNAVVHVFDIKKQEHRTIKFRTIIIFNGKRVKF